jgi:hypothetical protein
MPTSAKRPDQRSDRYPRYIDVGPMSATHVSRWVHPNGTTPTLRAVEQVRADHRYRGLSMIYA